MQGKKLSKTLSLVAILALIAATYFGIQNAKLKKLNKELPKAADVRATDLYKKQVSRIDSLLVDGNYIKALNLYKALDSDTILQDKVDLDIRINMSKKLAALSKSLLEKKDIEKTQKSDSAEISLQRSEESSNSDLALKQAQLEIKRLKTQLSNFNSNDYLRFKTSKGTKLHYLGGVKSSKANGYGIAILETGSRYEGQWKDNLRHGEGKFYWNDGEIYEGQYRNDRREGQGIYYWENGEKYVGEWKDDRRNGEGQFYNKRGKLKASGIWKDDELIEEKEEGEEQ